MGAFTGKDHVEWKFGNAPNEPNSQITVHNLCKQGLNLNNFLSQSGNLENHSFQIFTLYNQKHQHYNARAGRN